MQQKVKNEKYESKVKKQKSKLLKQKDTMSGFYKSKSSCM